MANLNKVFLIGRLTRDPELRYIPSGVAVSNFSMAISRVYTVPQSGEKKEEVCFVRVIAWGRQAETCSQYLSKGRLVFVEGRLQYRTWETQDGQKRSTLEVRAERVQFLERIKEVAKEPTFVSDEEIGKVLSEEKFVEEESSVEGAAKEPDDKVPF